MENKKPTILMCADGPQVSTGFGRVCGNLVERLLKTGKYKIVVMATNDRGEYHPIRGSHPDLIIEPLPYIGEDPYGLQRMPEILNKYQPDLVFSLNDVWVWTADDRHPQMLNWFFKHLKNYRPFVPWVGYFPVDGRPWEKRWVDLVNAMTYSVVFSDYGHKVLAETDGVDMNKVKIIYHGHDSQNYFPLPKEESQKIKKEMNIPLDSFLVGCINRNQPRKNIPALIQAFKMFHSGYVKCKTCNFPRNLEVMKDCELCGDFEYVPGREGISNSYLYLHMNMLDGRGYRLPKIQNDNKCPNIIARMNHDVAVGVSIQELNYIYNACDVVVNPTTAGGYELTVAEAMAAGTPVIATRTTSITEQLQDDRGYLVRPSSYMVLDDANHCLKHIIDLQGLVDALFEVHDNPEEAERRAQNALPFAQSRNWDLAAKQFEELFDQALQQRVFVHENLKADVNNVLIVNESNNFGNILSMVPAINEAISKDQNTNISISVKKEFIPLLRNLPDSIKVLDFEKLWLQSDELQKYKFSVNTVGRIPQDIEMASLRADNATIYSYIESFAKLWGVKLQFDENFKLKNKIYTITSEEKQLAREKIGEDNLKKFKVAVIANSTDPNFSIDSKTYSKAINLLSKMNSDVLSIGFGNKEELEELGTNLKFENLELTEIISILSECDCIVTSSEEYIHLANVIEVPFVIIEGPKKFSHLLKHALSEKKTKKEIKKLIYPVNNASQFQCMPCFKQSDAKCPVGNTPRAECMKSISHANIFAALSNVRDIWFEKK